MSGMLGVMMPAIGPTALADQRAGWCTHGTAAAAHARDVSPPGTAGLHRYAAAPARWRRLLVKGMRGTYTPFGCALKNTRTGHGSACAARWTGRRSRQRAFEIPLHIRLQCLSAAPSRRGGRES